MTNKDNTAVQKILGQFDDFIAAGKDAEDSSTSLSTSNVATRLNFDGTEDSRLLWDTSVPEIAWLKSRRQNLATVSTQTTVLEEPKQLSFMESVKSISASNLIHKLESEVGSLATIHKRARIEFDQEAEQIRIDHKKDKEKLEDAQMELRRLVEKQALLRQEFLEYRKAAETTRTNLEGKLSAVQTEKLLLETKYSEENALLSETISEMKVSLNQQQHDKEMALQESEELRERLNIQANAMEDLRTIRMELDDCKSQLMLSALKSKELEDQLLKNDENSRLAQMFHPQLNRVPELEKEIKQLKEENRIFREDNTNILLLEEKIESLRNALERSEKRCSDMIHLQFENEDLKNRVTQWEALDSSRSPAKIAQQISELQQKEIMWLAKVGEQKSRINTLLSEKKELETKVLSCKQNAQKEERNLQLNSELIKRLQKKLLLVTKERDSYQRVLQSYESEVTVNIATVTQDRIQTLENIIEGYRTQLEKAELDLASANKKLLSGAPSTVTNVAEQKLLMDTRRELEDRNSQLEMQTQLLQEQLVEMEKINSTLKQEVEGLSLRLEHRTLKGDYDPLSTRVVHLKLNPLAVAQKVRENELDRLRKDNEALRERVRLLLEDGKEAALELTAKVEHNLQAHGGTTKELEELKEQVTAAELKNKRLMEAFSEKSQEFREVCYMLVGYRIDMISTRQYKVTSMYAENAEDSLLFKLSSKGEMQLLETPFSKQMSILIDTFLKRQHSIPAFLSSITLELFGQQTATTSLR